MSENRFRITTIPKSNAVAFDEKQKKHYIGIDLEDLLNEQQATIQSLKEENDDLRFALRTEQAFARVEKDKRPFLSKEEFLKELEDE